MEGPCTLLIHGQDKQDPANVSDVKNQLQNGSVEQKITAMKQVILLTVSGEAPPGLSIVIFQFIMTQRDHTLKKLVLLYLEVCEKTGKDGKLLPEMILVWFASLPPRSVFPSTADVSVSKDGPLFLCFLRAAMPCVTT